MPSSAEIIYKIWKQQGAGYYCLATKSIHGGWRDVYFKGPVKKETIDEFIEANNKRNLYFCPTALREPRRVKDVVSGSRFLWADLDEADPRSCDIKPQVAWESSPKRYAALWRLNDFHKPSVIEESNRALTYSIGADKAGWDLTQVLRIPGTRNYKYPNAPRGKLLWWDDKSLPLEDFPEEVVNATEDARELLQKWKRKLKRPTYNLLTATRATHGKRSEVIWRLENDLHEQGVPKGDIFTLIKASVWNKFANRRDEDDQLRRELSKLRDDEGDRVSIAGGVRSPSERTEPVIVRMKDIEPEKVSWLWYPYIARGKLTIVEGDPGLGKSWLTMALASHLSLRKRLPGARRLVGGRVLLFSAEDGLADTIRPRLDTMGADVGRIFAYNDAVTFDEEGCDQIEEHIRELRPVAIIVDPLVAYLGSGIDMHKANETREVTARLARLAERHRMAVIAVRHLRKGGADKSIYRGIGSIDLVAAARSVILVAPDPEDNHARIMAPHKNNLGPLGQPLRYELRAGSNKPFRWAGHVNTTADELLKADSKKSTGGVSEFDMAKEFIEASLSGGARDSDVLRREAEARGISTKTLNRAAQELHVKRTEKKWSLD